MKALSLTQLCKEICWQAHNRRATHFPHDRDGEVSDLESSCVSKKDAKRQYHFSRFLKLALGTQADRGVTISRDLEALVEACGPERLNFE